MDLPLSPDREKGAEGPAIAIVSVAKKTAIRVENPSELVDAALEIAGAGENRRRDQPALLDGISDILRQRADLPPLLVQP